MYFWRLVLLCTLSLCMNLKKRWRTCCFDWCQSPPDPAPGLWHGLARSWPGATLEPDLGNICKLNKNWPTLGTFGAWKWNSDCATDPCALTYLSWILFYPADFTSFHGCWSGDQKCDYMMASGNQFSGPRSSGEASLNQHKTPTHYKHPMIQKEDNSVTVRSWQTWDVFLRELGSASIEKYDYFFVCHDLLMIFREFCTAAHSVTDSCMNVCSFSVVASQNLKASFYWQCLHSKFSGGCMHYLYVVMYFELYSTCLWSGFDSLDVMFGLNAHFKKRIVYECM